MQVIGINAEDQAASNDLAVADRVLPWLQDTLKHNVWTSWKGEWRDVMVCDAQNRRLVTYNLFDHPLDDAANVAELRQLILAAAGAAGPGKR